jgi:hypothetical protein
LLSREKEKRRGATEDRMVGFLEGTAPRKKPGENYALERAAESEERKTYWRRPKERAKEMRRETGGFCGLSGVWQG